MNEKKKIVVTGYTHFATQEDVQKGLNNLIAIGNDAMEAHDGYHSFGELYEHRFALYIALCKSLVKDCEECKAARGELRDKVEVWRSKIHSDDTSYPGWFIMGIGREAGKQISYHLPERFWDVTNFAVTLEKAPAFDGHTPNDVIKRLGDL